MSEFLKPQSPLQHKDGAYVYPLTTADQVILDDNTRLPSALENLVYAEETVQESDVVPVDADTLGGKTEDLLHVAVADNTNTFNGYTVNALRAMFLNSVYPVGSIYMSVNSTSPADLFGGTWEALEDRFLLGASSNYSAGSTGGEAEHTLTIDEMPPHYHEIPWNLAGSGRRGTNNYTDSAGFNGNSQYNTDTRGGGEPHNNMPPYLAVYMWKRTA